MQKNRLDLLRDGPLILHDNKRPHSGNVVADLLGKYGWEILPLPPYSPNMIPPDFNLFPQLPELVGVSYRDFRLSVDIAQRIRQLNKGGDWN